MVDSIGSVGYFIFYFKAEVMLNDPEFQNILMALLSFVIGWFFKRPQDLMKKK
jgi:hypothetical protein